MSRGPNIKPGDEYRKADGSPGLVVIERRGSQGNNPLWLCRCHCGGQTLIKTSNLCAGHRSCGCERGNFAPRPGELSPTSKLTDAQVIEARKLRRRGHGYREILAMIGSDARQHTLSRAVRGITWSHLPLPPDED